MRVDLEAGQALSTHDAIHTLQKTGTGATPMTINLTAPAGDLLGFYVEFQNASGSVIRSVKVKTSGGTVRHIVLKGGGNDVILSQHECKFLYLPSQAIFKGLTAGDILEFVIGVTSGSNYATVEAFVGANVKTT